MSTLSLIVWKKEFSVGVERIDSQHRRMIELTNELYSSLREDSGEKDKTRRVLSSLQEYAALHFSDEEYLMRAVGYPDYESHKRDHDWMTGKVAVFVAQYRKDREDLTFEIFTFLKKWWTDHITGMDRKYAPYLKP